MKMNGRIIYLFFTLVSWFLHLASVTAQEYLLPLNRDLNTRIEPFYERDSLNIHSSMKPFSVAELRNIIPLDSIQGPIANDTKFNRTWTGRKLRKEHFIEINQDDLKLSIDPVFNFQLGRDNIAKDNVYVNSRGILVQGDVRESFFSIQVFVKTG